jgi:phenylalanyl-tRNA synthetase beta chain
VLDAVAYNLARGAREVRLFESGRVYWPNPGGGLPVEQHQLVGVIVGASALEAKAHVEAVLGTLRVPFAVEQIEHPVLHPGKAGLVRSGEQDIGLLGELHPLVTRAWDIDGPAAGFKLDLGLVSELAPHAPIYRDVTSFPAVRQDIAVVVAHDVPAQRVVDVVRGAGGRLLSRAEVFDAYDLGERGRSLALHLEFRAADRTLTEDEVRKVVDKVVGALSTELGAEQRG